MPKWGISIRPPHHTKVDRISKKTPFEMQLAGIEPAAKPNTLGRLDFTTKPKLRSSENALYSNMSVSK